MWNYSTEHARGFQSLRALIIKDLLETEPENQGYWQQLDISQSPLHATYELLNVNIQLPIPATQSEAVNAFKPDLPWAEGHFQERVGGLPVNPGDWHDKWPYHGRSQKLHLRGKIYDHNYMERMWPKNLLSGYRYGVGDLNDVVKHLAKKEGSRQAYLPIWFPEDTGAKQDQRVPCTLGYHFLIRGGKLHLFYPMRSCEIYRHFTNDVYMAARLAQWVCERLPGDITPGNLTMSIASLHGFYGDREKILSLESNQ